MRHTVSAGGPGTGAEEGVAIGSHRICSITTAHHLVPTPPQPVAGTSWPRLLDNSVCLFSPLWSKARLHDGHRNCNSSRTMRWPTHSPARHRRGIGQWSCPLTTCQHGAWMGALQIGECNPSSTVLGRTIPAHLHARRRATHSCCAFCYGNPPWSAFLHWPRSPAVGVM